MKNFSKIFLSGVLAALTILPITAFAAFASNQLAPSPANTNILETNGTASSWVSQSSIQAVTSVFGRTGVVVATAGDYTTALVTEVTNLYFTNARAIAATLTGFSATTGTVSSSDSILVAIEKLAGNGATYLTGNQTITLSGDVSGSGTTAITTAIGANKVTLADIAQIGANTVLVNGTGATANVTAQATSTFGTNLFGVGTGGKILAEVLGVPTWTATTTFSSPLLYSAGNVTCQVATASVPGCLAAADFTTFNGKQAAGNYITSLTGDVTATGPGSVSATLATVNTNTGSWGSSTAIPNFTVNGKGLITAAGTNVVIAPAGTLSGTTLNSTVVSSSLTSVGTLSALTISGNLTLSALTGTQCLQEISGVVSGTGSACGSGSGGVTSVTGTYPVISSGGSTPAISLAFGTTTSNTWAGTQTFTNSPVFSTLGAGTVNSTSGGNVYNTSTSTPTLASGLAYTGTLGQFISGTSGTLSVSGLTTSNFTSANVSQFTNDAGYLTSSTGVTSLKQTYGTAQSGALTLATTSTAFNGLTVADAVTNVAGAFTITPLWSGTLNNTGLTNSTISGVSLGSNLNALTIGTHLTGTSYNGSAPITIATDATNANTVSTIVARDGSGNFAASTGTFTNLIDTGVTANTLAYSNASQQLTAVTLGTGIGFTTGTISNTGVTSIVAGTNITVSGATGAVTINAPTASNYFTNSGASTFLSTGSNLGIGTSTPFSSLSVSTTTQSSGLNSLFTVASTTNATLFNVAGNGNVGLGTTTPTSQFSINPIAGGPVNVFSVGSSTLQTFNIKNDGAVMINASNAADNSFAINPYVAGNATNIAIGNGTAGFTVNVNATTGGGTTLINTANGGSFVGNNFTANIVIDPIAPLAPLIFGTGGSANANERLRITGLGYIGIGTTSPSAMLDIASSTGQQLALSDGSATDAHWAFRNVGGILNIGTTSPTTYATSTPSGLQISSQTATQVGIGSTTPWRTLSVTGTVGFDGLTTTSAAQSGAICISANKEIVNESLACNTSAFRFKQDIRPFDVNALNEVNDLKVVTFYYKPDYNGSLQSNPNFNGQRIGFIADDVQKVDPRLVNVETGTTTFEGTTYPAGTAHGLDDEQLIALNTKAIQELSIIKSSRPLRSAEENWQWIAIGILFLWNIYLTRKIKPV